MYFSSSQLQKEKYNDTILFSVFCVSFHRKYFCYTAAGKRSFIFRLTIKQIKLIHVKQNLVAVSKYLMNFWLLFFSTGRRQKIDDSVFSRFFSWLILNEFDVAQLTLPKFLNNPKIFICPMQFTINSIVKIIFALKINLEITTSKI